MTETTTPAKSRIGWVDYAKGICIILVVMYHVVGGLNWHFDGEGWMQPVVDFARPFRMPDFFLISGLFLSRTLFGPTATYFDRKLLHFIYFYVLWLTLQLPVLEYRALLDAPTYFAKLYILALFEPTNTLWFVHMLAVFYVVTWLVRGVNKYLVLAVAIGLQTAYQFGLIDTGWNVIDRFANRYVYFYFGYMAAPFVFALAERIASRRAVFLSILPAWGVANWMMVGANMHNMPGTSLILGMAGAFAVCAVSASLDRSNLLTGLRFAGQNSIVIYLSFLFPKLAMEQVFLRFGLPFDSLGWASLISLTLAVVIPLIFYLAIRETPLSMLYIRPSWAKWETLSRHTTGRLARR